MRNYKRYLKILTNSVRPGDWRKWVPTNGGRPQYRQVIQVLPDRNLVQIDDKGREPWVYLTEQNVTYGRKLD